MATAPRLATYEDILHLGEKVRAEVIAGQIVVAPSPATEHQYLGGALFSELHGAFQRGRSGPGGWWLIQDVDVWFAPHDVVRPDIAGWRRENVPDLPARPVRARPDWICEALSPGNAKYDLGAKRTLYANSGVPWFWIADPVHRTIQVLRLEGASYVVHQTAGDEGLARLEPFDAIELELDALFAPTNK